MKAEFHVLPTFIKKYDQWKPVEQMQELVTRTVSVMLGKLLEKKIRDDMK